ncbi:hypothetical protein Acy02nite_84040 [Actinoplanes cyaneus]|uniref:SCP2 domain-containing protein n=1 Tax=Actinoplanes cyaneus TaxID=52696 RepID=A0A919MAH1_9ACTN|nr:SCP2 sterol-binding domain-containing protein [Actinoplanes cyaneus]MCW2138181.1 SCP-2 sterol transfer family protein [Actinoplanes cyaneus]GID70523.1 hypothetical protein Acy02nite_84040 [Actinoplanes cyaneus]
MPIQADPAIDPGTFALEVKDASDRELEELMRGSRRTPVLTAVFRGMPDVFRADRAGSLHAVVHWHVGHPGGGPEDVWEVEVRDRRCEVRPGTTAEPRLRLTLDAVNFIKMTTGNAQAWTLFLRGRLKARGDLGLAKTFPRLFEVPRV